MKQRVCEGVTAWWWCGVFWSRVFSLFFFRHLLPTSHLPRTVCFVRPRRATAVWRNGRRAGAVPCAPGGRAGGVDGRRARRAHGGPRGPRVPLPPRATPARPRPHRAPRPQGRGPRARRRRWRPRQPFCCCPFHSRSVWFVLYRNRCYWCLWCFCRHSRAAHQRLRAPSYCSRCRGLPRTLCGEQQQWQWWCRQRRPYRAPREC